MSNLRSLEIFCLTCVYSIWLLLLIIYMINAYAFVAIVRLFKKDAFERIAYRI